MWFLWLLAALSAVAGGLAVTWAFLFVSTAPAQAALAACGIGFAVVPYVFCRAVSFGQLRQTITEAVRAAAIPPVAKTCPRCAEDVKSAAEVCRFCGHVFSGEQK